MKPTAIETLNGGTFDFAGVLAGESQHYDLSEIAWCLAHTVRYVGHTQILISVAEHSVAVSRRAEQLWGSAAAWGLMHDAHEAYIGDMCSPLKKLLRANEETMFDQVADEIDQQIRIRFGVGTNGSILDAVKQADREACAWERENIRHSKQEWAGIPEVPKDHAGTLNVYGLAPLEARALFLKRCEELRIR